MSNFLLQQVYSDRRENGQKPTRTKPSRQKTPLQNPGQKPPRTIEREFVQGAFVRAFLLDLLKIGGVGPRSVTYFWGVPGCVTKCDRGRRGVKMATNSMMYFMTYLCLQGNCLFYIAHGLGLHM